MEPISSAPDRRQIERRVNAPIGELSVPEVRRIVITSILFVVVLTLFLWMVRMVIIAAILGAVLAGYLRPVYRWVRDRLGNETLAALLTLTTTLVPLIAGLVYGYVEVRGVAEYLAQNEAQVAREIDEAVQRLPYLNGMDTYDRIRGMVATASAYGTRVPGAVSEFVGEFAVAASVFLFTAFYIFTDSDTIIAYLRAKIPPRYTELMAALERSVRGVLYGAIYATLVTQAIKSGIILALNLVLGVPLPVVLALVSFVIGFFPIVGSWSVYVPVAGWLLIFRDSPWAALVMLAVGFFVNTLFISMYLRPKLAADKSHVLNFYWMFLGLVTGVYTFGLAGVLLGPLLIGLLKAIIDTVTTRSSWRLMESDDWVAPEPPA